MTILTHVVSGRHINISNIHTLTYLTMCGSSDKYGGTWQSVCMAATFTKL